MSLIIIPQISSQHNSYHWKPEVVEKTNFVQSLYELVKRKAMNVEKCLFVADEEFECVKFTSNAGTTPNIVFQKMNGPVVYYKKNGFGNKEKQYMLHMIEKVKGKQINYFFH